MDKLAVIPLRFQTQFSLSTYFLLSTFLIIL
nr:MAG TPA: hypothetical protein [Caudoviricetes sp.]